MKDDVPPVPIDAYREQIERAIAKNPVTVLTAETGTGKSTRVPLWLWQKGQRVHVTQPRRIATRSLSYYLARLSRTTLGNQIGYQTGFDRKFSRQTRLLYLTDGVQMVQEVRGDDSYDVLILDEIHEWNLNQEILVGLVRQKLKSRSGRRSGQRIVIMSATLEAGQLAAFLDDAPVISIPGRGFPVTMHNNHPHFLLSDTVQLVEMGCNILVFQPGKKEIDDFITKLKETLAEDKLKAMILPLHSELAIKEQSKVFDHFPVPKVVVATDIAQTSLTIDDIDAVIDTGIKKEIHNIKGVEGLYPVQISRAEIQQRSGRAGRVKSGQYILCSEIPITDRPPFPEPEIRRLNLETAVLRLIKWGIAPLTFEFFHSPNRSLLYKALQKLKVFGAITFDEKVTPDGERMAELPVTIRSARLLIEALKGSAQTVDNALKIISILENKGIAGRDYVGQKLYPESFQSDLLNQLCLWNNPRQFKVMISQKKLALAREIYHELKNRIQFYNLDPKPRANDTDLLYRAVLSALIDFVYMRQGGIFIREDEERQLERSSLLQEKPPEMAAGIPFDLIINRDNPLTGEKERVHLPLLTFACEINLALLDALKPFSYERKKEFRVENNKLRICNQLFFADRVVREFMSEPDWKNPEDRAAAIPVILDWLQANEQSLNIYAKKTELRHYFSSIAKIIPDLPPFEDCWTRFIRQELDSQDLNRNLMSFDLIFFFQFHAGFKDVHLQKLLSPEQISLLKKSRWPKNIPLRNQRVPVIYIHSRPYLKLSPSLFEQTNADNLILPTGDEAGILFFGRRYDRWPKAVQAYNRWKKQDIYKKKWQSLKVPAQMSDVADIEFPQPFTAGQGKDQVPFEFFLAPEITDDTISLIHFPDHDSAAAYFASIQPDWIDRVHQFKKKSLESLFKSKGWNVKS